ncbi:hypothetical protein PanWU01x14_190530, partial [Parasponia andersonii]
TRWAQMKRECITLDKLLNILNIPLTSSSSSRYTTSQHILDFIPGSGGGGGGVVWDDSIKAFILIVHFYWFQKQNKIRPILIFISFSQKPILRNSKCTISLIVCPHCVC